MLTKTEVANYALRKLGISKSIINIDTETTIEARILRDSFNMSITQLLDSHTWYFANKIAGLPLLRENPSRTWRYAYAIPADCHIIRQISETDMFLYEEEYPEYKRPFELFFTPGGYEVHTNVQNAVAKYTVSIPTDGPFINYFGRALGCQLAKDTAATLITNNYQKMKDLFLRDVNNEISQQMATDISQAPAPRNMDAPMIAARMTNSGGGDERWGPDYCYRGY